jgi:hypothetical protein
MPIRQAVTAEPAPRIFSTLPSAAICARRGGRRTKRRSYSCSDQRIGRIPASTSLGHAAPALVVVAGVREDAASTGDADMVCLRLVVDRSATSAVRQFVAEPARPAWSPQCARRPESHVSRATHRRCHRSHAWECRALAARQPGPWYRAASMSMMSRADPSSTSTMATFRCLGARGCWPGRKVRPTICAVARSSASPDKCRCDHRASGAIALLAVIERVTRHLSNQSRLAFDAAR